LDAESPLKAGLPKPLKIGRELARPSLGFLGRSECELRLTQVCVVEEHLRVTLAGADPDHVPFRIDVLTVAVLPFAAGEELGVVSRQFHEASFRLLKSPGGIPPKEKTLTSSG
jgi:hypothetical protein